MAAHTELAPGLQDAIAGGHFARRFFDPRSGVIGWSHRRRFAFGLQLVAGLAPRSLLDYGCGDGTFLAMAAHHGYRCVGAELSDTALASCRDRFSGVPVSFCGAADVAGSFDVVTCMEVLEHAPDPGALLDRLRECVRPGGTVVISVPIETGLSLLVKAVARKLAGWRGMAEYAEYASYTWRELARSVLAAERQHIPRVLNPALYGVGAYEHKGFNWRVLRGMVAGRFEVVDTRFTPIRWFGPLLNSQAWIVARRPLEQARSGAKERAQ